jgi:hypothetical protein
MGHIQNVNRIIKLEARLLSCHQLNRCQGYGMAFLKSMCRKGTGTSLNQKASSFFHYGGISVTEQLFLRTMITEAIKAVIAGNLPLFLSSSGLVLEAAMFCLLVCHHEVLQLTSSMDHDASQFPL